MSLLYWFIIREIGHFSLGRCVDLFQRDCIVGLLLLIAVCEIYGVKWRRKR